MSRITRTALALAASAAIVGACGSSGTPAPAATTAAAAAAAVNIDIQGFKFPANTDVAKGTKVTWTNKDSTAHTVTSGTRPNKDGKFDSGQLAGSATFFFTFTDAGTFNYWCQNHSSMNGTITVK
jgi:plastocyanin